MNEDNMPKLILGVESGEKTKLPEVFFEENGVFFNLLFNPPYLRYMGWNLRTLDTPTLKDGEYWEVKNSDRKTLRLYFDGSLIASAAIAHDFLGWMSKENQPQIHPLAVVEYIYEFVEFYRKVIQNAREMGSEIKSCRFKIGIKNLETINEKLIILPFEVNTYGFLLPGFERPHIIEKDFISESEKLEFNSSIYDSKYAAFELAAILFRKFGVSNNKIPYTAMDETDKRFIDVEKIKLIN